MPHWIQWLPSADVHRGLRLAKSRKDATKSLNVDHAIWASILHQSWIRRAEVQCKLYGRNIQGNYKLILNLFSPKMRLGQCRQPTGCINGMAYWPADGKCYTLHTRGPCSRGRLLSWNQDQLAECAVSVIEGDGQSTLFFISI